MNTNTELGLEDLFHELSMTDQRTCVDRLDELVRIFPRFAHELTDFAAELAFDNVRREEGGVKLVEETDPMVARAMSKLHNRMYEVRQKPVVNPYASLSSTDLRGLGTKLQANTLFVMMLRDRRIRPETISVGFRRHTANLLGVSEAVVAAHHMAPPVIQRENRFKSEGKPEVSGQESFENALVSCELTDEQQRFLLSL
jgi:hypothetical protein